MSTPDPYEQHRAAFGAELRRVAPTVRLRRRRVFALGGASVALAAAATAAVIVAPTTGSRLDVVADARAAISDSPDRIVHYALTVSSDYPLRRIDIDRAKGCRPSEPGEIWRATTPGPPRYRMRFPMNPCGVNEIEGRIVTGAFDLAYADRTQKIFSPGDGFMKVITDLPAIADEQTPFGGFGDSRLTADDPRDPVARIRSLLADGKLTDKGPIRGSDGRLLRRLVGKYTELRGDPRAQKPWPVSVDYRVDAETFAPVVIVTKARQSVPEDPNARPIRRTVYVHRTITERIEFKTYETLPLTAKTEALLTVDPPAGTDVTTAPAPTTPTNAAVEPSAAERARAKTITDAQIAAGTRVRAEY